ncbi:MAG TPA: twin-arginine translocation signal domain-containing protein [Verrucomicrobiales bacterium]|nr:twin-arginine translocation signal domain-containing protein [Verrucomicrobiales bacterium]
MSKKYNFQSRRDFLKRCSLAGLGLAAPVFLPGTGYAAEKEQPPYEGPYYAVFNASGGWDTTYLMDPKGTGGINRLYKEGDIKTHGNHKFAPNAAHMQGGMSNEDFYAAFGKELLVVNGIDYSVNNHSPGQRYMATGKLDSLAYPTFAALVAACKGPGCPLSFLTFGNYSNTGNLVAMSRVPYLPSLQRVANADCIDGQVRSPYHDDFAMDRIERALKEQSDAALTPPVLPRTQRAESMLYAAQFNSKSLQRITPWIPDKIPKERLSQQVEIALASFKAGVCVSANLSIGQFDSHANNDTDQMKLIPDFSRASRTL